MSPKFVEFLGPYPAFGSDLAHFFKKTLLGQKFTPVVYPEYFLAIKTSFNRGFFELIEKQFSRDCLYPWFPNQEASKADAAIMAKGLMP